MTKEEGSVQLADAAWTLCGALQTLIPLTSLTQGVLAGKLPIILVHSMGRRNAI
jgi:hypothetical protein